MHIYFRKFLLLAILTLPITLNVPADTLFDGRFNTWEKKALAGDKYSQYKLGRSYLLGSQVKVDIKLAIKWLEKAALQGHTKAAYRLGFIYYSNLDGTKNYAKALKWFGRAAKANHAESQYYIALMYFEGRGVTKNADSSLKWAYRAKQNGETQTTRLIAKLQSIKKRDRSITKYKASTNAPKISFKTRDIILAGQWKSDTPLAKEIPLALKNCIKRNNKIKCASKRLKKFTKNYTADYIVESELSGFKKNGAFVISYRYNYLFVLPEDADDPSPTYFLPGIGKTELKILKCHILAKTKMKCYTKELHAVRYTRH